MTDRLPRSFYCREPRTVARQLLGQKLVRVDRGRRLAGIIVETEAYLGCPDQAAHTYQGHRSKRNQTMWGQGGLLYVYFVYGMHHCANVVASQAGDPVAVLLRALEPVEGLELMQKRRGRATLLCSGPARLCQALGIDRRLDGYDLAAAEDLFIEPNPAGRFAIVTAPRIGVEYAGTWAGKPLRYYIRGNRHVSRP